MPHIFLFVIFFLVLSLTFYPLVDNVFCLQGLIHRTDNLFLLSLQFAPQFSEPQDVNITETALFHFDLDWWRAQTFRQSDTSALLWSTTLSLTDWASSFCSSRKCVWKITSVFAEGIFSWCWIWIQWASVGVFPNQFVNLHVMYTNICFDVLRSDESGTKYGAVYLPCDELLVIWKLTCIFTYLWFQYF